MRWFIAFVLATTVSCSDPPLHGVQVDAGQSPDACPLPFVRPDCVADGFTTLDPDGAWHLTGTFTTTVEDDLDPNTPPKVTTGSVDQQLNLQRFGCAAGLSFTGTPASMPHTAVSSTAISGDCDHAPGCMRGTSTWSVCVNAAGELTYVAYDHSTST